MKKKQEKKASGPRTVSPKFPMNIDQDVYDVWQLYRGVGDVNKLAAFVGVSVPIIERAMNFGNAKKEATVIKITTFYQKKSESMAGKMNNILKKMSEQL